MEARGSGSVEAASADPGAAAGGAMGTGGLRGRQLSPSLSVKEVRGHVTVEN